MDETQNLQLPYIMAAQSQKHVTHNEAIRNLDALVQLAVKDRDLSAPPGSPGEGERYIVAGGASGAWSGKEGYVAAFQDGAWMFYLPRAGWRCWVEDEGVLLVYDGALWGVFSGFGGMSSIINNAANGAQNIFKLDEEELTLSGAFVDSTIQIPDRAIVFAVTARTTQTITGASSYDCGIASDPGKYGSLLGITSGSTNSGVTGPSAYYADTPVRLGANGGNFSGGKVRIAIHYMLCSVSTS